MPLTVEGRVFFTATEVAKEIGVVRQTVVDPKNWTDS